MPFTLDELALLDRHLGAGLRRLARVLEEGERTHKPMDWKAIGIQGNMNRSSLHNNAMAFDSHDEDHLAHAACRLLMALTLREEATPENLP